MTEYHLRITPVSPDEQPHDLSAHTPVPHSDSPFLRNGCRGSLSLNFGRLWTFWSVDRAFDWNRLCENTMPSAVKPKHKVSVHSVGRAAKNESQSKELISATRKRAEEKAERDMERREAALALMVED